jgi:nicotinamidase-related amidase
VKIGTIVPAISEAATELKSGFEPTISHAADLGLLPLLVADVCGSVNQQARKRRLDALPFGVIIVTDSKAIGGILARGGR